jgi:hypothetical protein
MKYYDDCFSGSDVLAWVHDFLRLNPNFGQNISRTQAKLLCQKLLQRNIFEDVVEQFKSTKPVFEENHLYCFVGKKQQGKVGQAVAEAKENENSFKSQVSSSKKGSTLKRHSSFSDRFQLSRKPLRDRKGLQNIPNDIGKLDNKSNKSKKPSQISLRHDANNENSGKKEKCHTKAQHSSAQLRGKHSGKGISGLTRKWKSEFDVGLSENIEQDCDVKYDEAVTHYGRSGQQGTSNNNAKLASDDQVDCHKSENITQKTVAKLCKGQSQETSNENPKRTPDDDEEESRLQTNHNELWMTVCLERYKILSRIEQL